MSEPQLTGAKGRVLVRTLLRPWRLNYGGMLQAWALQQALAELGYSSAVDVSRSDISTIELRAKYFVKGLVMRVLPAQLVPRRLRKAIIVRAMDFDALKFVRNDIKTVRLFSWRRRPVRRMLDQFDAFIAGSDQVWRRGMADVPTYLMDFLPDQDARPRIAYAASFGTDEPVGYDTEFKSTTARLARRMTTLSVREESAIGLCAEYWKVDAVRVADPIMLLTREHYEDLSRSDTKYTPDQALVTYILDPCPDSDEIVERAARTLKREPFSLLPEVPASLSTFRADRKSYMRPTARQWISAIASSEFVITDSYHGCVFSIIFHRPFILIPNKRRGLSRFHTLLGLFGLHSRAVGNIDSVEAIIEDVICWERVESVLTNERQRSLSFLAAALRAGADKPPCRSVPPSHRWRPN